MREYCMGLLIRAWLFVGPFITVLFLLIICDVVNLLPALFCGGNVLPTDDAELYSMVRATLPTCTTATTQHTERSTKNQTTRP